MRKINYLCVGHVCHDILGDDIALGGTTSYASIVAQKLGRHTGILSSYSRDFQFEDYLKSKDIQIEKVPSEETTTFENIYHSKGRTQYIHNRADIIRHAHIPDLWKGTDILHLCLIADEVADGFCQYLQKDTLVGLALQGAIRAVDDNKKVHSIKTDLTRYKGVDVVFLSDDDILGLEGIRQELKEVFPIVVITHGSDGASVITPSQTYSFPSFPTMEVDPTGAGDVFGAAFLIEYHRTSDITEASAFAHAAASFSIEGMGVASLPAMSDVIKRKEEYFKFLRTHIK